MFVLSDKSFVWSLMVLMQSDFVQLACSQDEFRVQVVEGEGEAE